jgi:death-on-curing protein
VAEYLDLADYLLIAEAVLGADAETLAHLPGIGLAESALAAPAMSFGGSEFFPDLIDKAAVLCSRIVKNHPLPDGNKRVAYLSMIEFLGRNGLTFMPPSTDETADAIERLAAGELSEQEFAAWLGRNVR